MQLTSNILLFVALFTLAYVHPATAMSNPAVNAACAKDEVGATAMTSDSMAIVACLYKGPVAIPYQWTAMAPASGSSPVGTIAYFATASCPTGWIEANGQSTAPYPKLAAAVGAAVPDLRGYFLRAWDHGRGIDAGRSLGMVQEDAIRNITGSFASAYGTCCSNLGAVDYGSGAIYWQPGGSVKDGKSGDKYAGMQHRFDASRVVPTATENRPKNIALLACIANGN